MIFQEPTLLPWRSLRENLRVTTGISAARADAALADVGLAGRGDDMPGRLSHGQQRRLALARAVASEPDLLLMDEPFVSLDPSLVEDMMSVYKRLRSRTRVATVFVTHVVSEARALADRVITLGGSPAEIVSEVDLRAQGTAQNSGAYFQLSASGVTSSRS